MRGDSPRIFIYAYSQNILSMLSESFLSSLRSVILEIHKVFLRIVLLDLNEKPLLIIRQSICSSMPRYSINDIVM